MQCKFTPLYLLPELPHMEGSIALLSGQPLLGSTTTEPPPQVAQPRDSTITQQGPNIAPPVECKMEAALRLCKLEVPPLTSPYPYAC